MCGRQTVVMQRTVQRLSFDQPPNLQRASGALWCAVSISGTRATFGVRYLPDMIV